MDTNILDMVQRINMICQGAYVDQRVPNRWL
jgi:hypothetical protein